MQDHYGKIKINCREECKKLNMYQTKYLTKTFTFIIIMSCFYYAVH